MYKELRKKEDNTPDGWSNTLKRDRLYFLKLLIDDRIRYIVRFLKPTILDAGCGRGEYVKFLNTLGFQSIGVDYSQSMITSNRNTFPNIKFETGTIQNLSFKDNEFDSIISWGVIEHDELGPEKAVREFYRVLKKNGSVFLTVPEDNIYQRNASQSEFLNGDLFFQYFFTQEELSKIISSCGFTIIKTGSLGRPNACLIWPKYNAQPKIIKLLLRILAIFYSSRYRNMIYCIATKP